ncbi:MAG: hypothetical protein KDK45_21560, partial [Leptospiraceae bacterium]|nr:hypothetical protein [Leptospiraceae bacterium]
FSGIQNLSSEHINTELLTADMKARMVELQIQLVDESQRKKAMEEIRLAQEGAVVERSALEAGKFISPSYIMKGEINDNVRYISGDKEQLLIFTFQLLELETGTIKWQNRYEHKRYIPKKNFGL